MPRTIAFVLAVLAADLAFAGSTREVTWSGVSEFTGKTIQFVTPGAVPVTGKLTAVEAEALLLRVEKSTDRTKYPKGLQLRLARADVRTFEVRRNCKHWRVIGTAVGAFVGLLLAAAIELSGGLFNSGGTARDVAAFTAWGGSTAAGFLLGRGADRKSFTVVIREQGGQSARRE